LNFSEKSRPTNFEKFRRDDWRCNLLRFRVHKTGSGGQELPTRTLHICGRARKLALAVIVLFLLPGMAGAEVLQTRYAIVHYDNEKQIKQLNWELFLSRDLAYQLRSRKIVTSQEEVGAKIDIIVEKVQKVLEMFPENLHFEIRLFATAKEAQDALYKRYGKKVDFISFYSRQENILYLSAEDAELAVVAHEIGHVVVEHYFERSPPVKIHEVLAQFAEKHITD
jgi:putative methionine-R-sulfoxide reductase with GAF domain